MTSLAVSAPADGTYAGIASSIAERSATEAATRGGTDTRPALRSRIASSEGVDELAQVQQFDDVVAGQQQHEPSLGGASCLPG